MTDIILHRYETSLYSEKARLGLGLLVGSQMADAGRALVATSFKFL